MSEYCHLLYDELWFSLVCFNIRVQQFRRGYSGEVSYALVHGRQVTELTDTRYLHNIDTDHFNRMANNVQNCHKMHCACVTIIAIITTQLVECQRVDVVYRLCHTQQPTADTHFFNIAFFLSLFYHRLIIVTPHRSLARKMPGYRYGYKDTGAAAS